MTAAVRTAVRRLRAKAKPPLIMSLAARDTLTIMGLRTVNELNDHSHWRSRQKRAKAQHAIVKRELAQWAVTRLTFELTSVIKLPVIVTLTRIAPRKLDVGDGDRASLKFVRDAVAAWLGVDDGPRETRVRWEYAPQERAGANQYGVKIRIEARDAIACKSGEGDSARR